jgi:hypothetical protein
MTPYPQDPQDVLDYPFDWTAAIGSDQIQTSQFVADTGFTVESDEILDSGHTLVWLSGGTPDKRYAVTNHILTLGGREYSWTIYVLVKEQ